MSVILAPWRCVFSAIIQTERWIVQIDHADKETHKETQQRQVKHISRRQIDHTDQAQTYLQKSYILSRKIGQLDMQIDHTNKEIDHANKNWSNRTP